MFSIIRSVLFFGVIFLFSIGCGSSNPNVAASVHGTVTYNGSPVPGGMVVYYSKTGGVFRSNLDRNGSYQINDAAIGDYEVTVETESINPNKKQEEYKGASGGGGMTSKYAKGGGSGSAPSGSGGGAKNKTAMKSSPMPDYAPQNKGEYVKIPSKYSDKEKSGLKTTLSSGRQEVNFPLID